LAPQVRRTPDGTIRSPPNRRESTAGDGLFLWQLHRREFRFRGFVALVQSGDPGVMADLSDTLEALERSRSQLSVTSYFDDALFRREMETIFRASPRYIGHELAVPEPGDYLALAQEGEGRALVRTPTGIELISNVCRHRQAVMLKGRGNTRTNIVCPLHRWTYDLNGELIGAPHFADDPCLNLRNYPVQTWNGLIFEAGDGSAGCHNVAHDLGSIGPRADLDFSGHVLGQVQLHECDYNWKTFIEVYLEDYHVGPFHPGLGQFVTCDDLRWEFGPRHSVQTVGANNSLAKAGSPAYRQWHDRLLAFRDGEPPRKGAIWLTYYPGVMVEWYPHVLVVSTLVPKGPRKTLNMVEFYYPEEVAAFEPELVAAQQAAYWETCAEDDEIALRMDAGRHALMERGDDEVGPYQSPMEDGMQHFHEWYRRVMRDGV
jgi:phenylpropionate dioxygenase-like ring-hydroxylating dioxygenase large terminal subunit